MKDLTLAEQQAANAAASYINNRFDAQGLPLRGTTEYVAAKGVPDRHYLIGRLVDLKAELPKVLERHYGGTATTVGGADVGLSNEALVETIKNLITAIGEGSLTKSHAQRLVKALCALIDSRLPK